MRDVCAPCDALQPHCAQLVCECMGDEACGGAEGEAMRKVLEAVRCPERARLRLLQWKERGVLEKGVNEMLRFPCQPATLRLEDGSTLLHAALEASSSKVEAVYTLVQDLGMDVDTRDIFGRTPLMLAAQGGRAEFVEALLDLGADADAEDPVRSRRACDLHQGWRWGRGGVETGLNTTCCGCCAGREHGGIVRLERAAQIRRRRHRRRHVGFGAPRQHPGGAAGAVRAAEVPAYCGVAATRWGPCRGVHTNSAAQATTHAVFEKRAPAGLASATAA